jgi:hypothetical protein
LRSCANSPQSKSCTHPFSSCFASEMNFFGNQKQHHWDFVEPEDLE